MESTRYLIVGGSHAALEALAAIRMYDEEGSAAVLTRDTGLPYSPTVLPYVVSGRSQPERVSLRGEDWFARNRASYVTGARVTCVHPDRNTVLLSSGMEMGYERLLLATGATPALPRIPGLAEVRYHVLRSMDDALGMRAAAARARRAVVLGAGLVGMHAAENLSAAGIAVTVVEMQSRVLPGYFDAEAGALIESVFSERGVEIMTGCQAIGVAQRGEGCLLELSSGTTLPADLLLIATGVTPAIEYLRGSAVQVDRGVLVDEAMRTNVPNIWAAGDVAQARSFFGGARVVNGILPEAVEQGRIAGMAMAGDPALAEYPGGVPLNTYSFFGHHAVSVGIDEAAAGSQGLEVMRRCDAAARRYLKIVLRDNRLLGIFSIGEPLDGGIMWQLVLRRTDLSAVKDRFLAQPQATGRALMSKTWR
jgi:phenylglyoxylate dehydrogenase epsilon subunit